MKPEDLRYSETHEWVHVEHKDGRAIATIGISAFAVQQLTDLVFMQLADIGKKLRRGDEFGEVESVKAVSPLYSPVSGTVTAVNSALAGNLEVLGSDPYGEGWMIQAAIEDESQLNQLMDYNRYQTHCAESH